MLRDSMALAIRRLMKRFMVRSSALIGMIFGNSGLGMAPDDVANRDPLRDQAELEEAVGHSLLGIDDLLRHRTDRIGHRIAVRLRPPRGLRKASDDVACVLNVVVRKIAVGEIEGIGLGDLIGVDEDPAVLPLLADRKIWIPDRPGLDAAI